MPHRVEILAYENAQLLDVTGPAQVFASANDMSGGHEKLYEIAIVAPEARVKTSAGIVLEADLMSEQKGAVGTFVVAGGFGVNAACDDAQMVDWVRQRAGVAQRVSSVCSGAFLLAQTGLLEGRRAATHWHRFNEFTARFPKVRLQADPIFVRDGRFWTSAGITAGIDMALAMVETDYGRGLALNVARELVVFLKRPGGQSQFSNMLQLQQSDERFERLHAFIAKHIAQDLPVETLAREAGMSLRTFSRRYRQSTGRTPREGVAQIRLETARQCLEDGMGINRTAAQCGYGATETMRRAFLKSLGVGPKAYRDRFHA